MEHFRLKTMLMARVCVVYALMQFLRLYVVPLKGKLTDSTRSSKLHSRVMKVKTQESRLENRESRKMNFGICINLKRT